MCGLGIYQYTESPETTAMDCEMTENCDVRNVYVSVCAGSRDWKGIYPKNFHKTGSVGQRLDIVTGERYSVAVVEREL